MLLQAAGPLLKELSKHKPAVEEESYEDPAEMEVSTPRSTSLMNQAAEGMRALGSFFAQAAMGGAEVRYMWKLLRRLFAHAKTSAFLSLGLLVTMYSFCVQSINA